MPKPRQRLCAQPTIPHQRLAGPLPVTLPSPRHRQLVRQQLVIRQPRPRTLAGQLPRQVHGL